MTHDGRTLSQAEAKLWGLITRSMHKRVHIEIDKTDFASLLNDDGPRVTAPSQRLGVPAATSGAQRPMAPAKSAPKLVAKPPAKPVATGLLEGTPPADMSGHKKVRRGKILIEARIDLHGFSQFEAQRELANFIPNMRQRGFRCVLVITGKGRPAAFKSGDFMDAPTGVLRRRLPTWLGGHGLQDHVSGYAPAHARHGGEGAFYVLLRGHGD